MIDLRLGDCREWLDTATADACISDPPYGVKFRLGKSVNRYGGNTRHHHMPIIGDDKHFDPAPLLRFPVVVLFGANNYADKLPASRGWIYWHKRPGMKPCDFGDGELIWTNQDHVIQHYEHMWSGVCRASEVGKEHYHPTQKPVALMAYLIERYTKPGDTVVDPYMGSGSTGVACVRTGRNFIGGEIDPTHYETAQRRIADAQAQLALPV
jgi:DNA modification methylase